MRIGKIQHTKKARKHYICDWCYERIDKESAYYHWFTFGENVTARMHPECYDAHLLVDDLEYLPPPGIYRRGESVER